MPIFTGLAATALVIGGAVAVKSIFDSSDGGGGGGFDGGARIAAPTGTGALTESEAQTAAKKRAFRSGVLFTSPTGLGSEPRTSSAKLR